jgi:hypothetical protein
MWLWKKLTWEICLILENSYVSYSWWERL